MSCARDFPEPETNKEHILRERKRDRPKGEQHFTDEAINEAVSYLNGKEEALKSFSAHMFMGFNEMATEAHRIAKDHGFHTPVLPRPSTTRPASEQTVVWSDIRAREFLASLMLIGTELAEAAEEVRKGSSDGIFEEIADVIIRCLDLCGASDVDIHSLVVEKMRKNEARPHKHGGKLI